MNDKGFTLIEILIVIVVMGIIAGFTLVKVDTIISNTRINVDSFNLSTLNDVTEDYAVYYSVNSSDIFDGINSDSERMTALVTNGYLTSPVTAQQSGASFEWNVTDQAWELEGGEINGYYDGTIVNYVFDSDSLDDITGDGTVSIDMSDWSTDDGYLENTTGESRIFIPISNSTYIIEVSAALSSGSSGGYGIFFDTTLDGDDATKDNGYVFQFDRGYGTGAMIVRPRENGRERGAVWTLREYNSTVFPSKSVFPDWWTDTHTIRIVVTNEDANTRNAEFFIDGTSIGSYSYSNEVDGEQIYTGFRGWGSSPTEFYSLTAN